VARMTRQHPRQRKRGGDEPDRYAVMKGGSLIAVFPSRVLGCFGTPTIVASQPIARMKIIENLTLQFPMSSPLSVRRLLRPRLAKSARGADVDRSHIESRVRISVGAKHHRGARVRYAGEGMQPPA
jgi:hypothetical protein